MKKPLHILQHDCDSLPPLPVSVYFLNKEMEVFPKQIFTITRKHINHESQAVEVYVSELAKFVEFNSKRIVPVVMYFAN